MTDRAINAYLYPRKVIPGCDHVRLYCKCDTPYHLREASPDEVRFEARLLPPLPKQELTHES